MRSSTRSKLAATAVFMAIAAVVVGGMTWATWATLELKKKDFADKQSRKIEKAVSIIDGYMGGIRASETMRSYLDYKAYFFKRPLRVWTREHSEVPDTTVVEKSPLLENGPRHDWIDLHFQVATDGDISSPQVIANPEQWLVEGGKAPPECKPRTCHAWDWLLKVLPGMNLAAAFHDQDGMGAHDKAEANVESTLVMRSNRPEANLPQPKFAAQRRRSQRDSLVGARVPPDCVAPEIATGNVTSRSEIHDDTDSEADSMFEGQVEIRSGDFARPFWVEPAPPEGPKLMFVRECTADADVFYQGFIGDWTRLKAELLQQLNGLDLFDKVDLVPTEPGEEPVVGTMINLPVRLVVPEVPGGFARAAWNSVGGWLLASWLTAVAVLAVAGVGLRNLVMLTERRMQFAYAVTHELRTPLTTFRLYSDMLSADLVPEPKKREYLSTLNRESQRLSTLVEDVLEYARLENRNVRLNPTELQAAVMLDRMTESLRTRCEANGLEGHANNTIANGLVVRTDVDLVQRIAGVLVSNACRHACGSDGAGVYLELSGDEHQVYLDIADTGPGIDRADQHNIFKPFRRGRRAEHTAQGGIGLGLALARDWANLLGGRLELIERRHPEYGGAHFRLTIPTRADT